MNPEWKAFLVENGTEFEPQALAQGMFLSTPTNRALIKVSGEDAELFLQNQLTNDIRNVSDTQHQASAWCSPKGRIIANFRIFKKEDAFYLSLTADLLELVLKKLQMYVMMSKVTIEDVTDSYVQFSFAGEGAAQHLQELIGADIAENLAIQFNSLSILRFSGSTERFEIFGELDDAKALWLQCKTKATAVGGSAWNYLNITSGIPEISAASSEAWIPQMVNYIDIGGVDFKKGCYPGQEVVARLNYLGKSKRRMFRMQIDTSDLPGVGDVIKSDSDNEVGKILNAAINPEGKIEALAILKIAEATNTLTLATNDEATITMLDLPYAVNDG